MNVFVFLSLLGSAGALKAYKIKLSSDGLAKNAKKETSSTYSDSTQMLITNGAMKDQALIQSESQETVFWRGKKKGMADYTKFLDHMTQFYGNVSQDDSACLTKCWSWGLDPIRLVDAEKEYSMTFVFGPLMSSYTVTLAKSVEGQSKHGGKVAPPASDGTTPLAKNQSFGCRQSPGNDDMLFFSDSAAHDCYVQNSDLAILGGSFDETRGVCVPWDSFGRTNCGVVDDTSTNICMSSAGNGPHVYKLKCTRAAPTPTPAPTPKPDNGSPTPTAPAPTPASAPTPAGEDPSPTPAPAPSPAPGDDDPTVVINLPPTPASIATPPPGINATPRPTMKPTPKPPTPHPTKWAGDTTAIRSAPTLINPWHCDLPTFPDRDAVIEEIFGPDNDLWELVNESNSVFAGEASALGGICADGRQLL